MTWPLRLLYDGRRDRRGEYRYCARAGGLHQRCHGQTKRIFCTYSAMLAIRRELSKITTVEVVS